MTHEAISAVLCLICLVLNAPWPCFFWPAAFYLGREHSQAEYRYIETHGRKRSLCPWWCGFAPEAWTAKGILDWICPLAVGLAFLIIKETIHV